MTINWRLVMSTHYRSFTSDYWLLFGSLGSLSINDKWLLIDIWWCKFTIDHSLAAFTSGGSYRSSIIDKYFLSIDIGWCKFIINHSLVTFTSGGSYRSSLVDNYFLLILIDKYLLLILINNYLLSIRTSRQIPFVDTSRQIPFACSTHVLHMFPCHYHTVIWKYAMSFQYK